MKFCLYALTLTLVDSQSDEGVLGTVFFEETGGRDEDESDRVEEQEPIHELLYYPHHYVAQTQETVKCLHHNTPYYKCFAFWQ